MPSPSLTGCMDDDVGTGATRLGVPTPGPWHYNDPAKFQQFPGKFSGTAVYAAGNIHPWRMCEVQGPDEKTEIATARLIAAAPNMYNAIREYCALVDAGEKPGRAFYKKLATIIEGVMSPQVSDSERSSYVPTDGDNQP